MTNQEWLTSEIEKGNIHIESGYNPMYAMASGNKVGSCFAISYKNCVHTTGFATIEEGISAIRKVLEQQGTN